MALAAVKGKAQGKNKASGMCGTNYFDGNCSFCGKHGHEAADCWNKQKGGSSSEKKGTKSGGKARKTLREQFVEMTEAWAADRARWAADRADLESQVAVERKWRMHYEGIVRTCANGHRDLEREVREAGWPSRRSAAQGKRSKTK